MAKKVTIVPRKVKQRSTESKELNLGRDDLSFISSIPDEIDIECPVCLQVMVSYSHLVSCCGHHYCDPCMKRLKKDNMPCPCCKEEDYHAMVDKGRARIINGLQVSCINKGCQWIGQLKCLPAHLNRGEREGECQYELVECKCHVKVKRINAENHENNECSQRPYQCEHCSFVSSYEWITQQHYSKCNKYPVPCPNNCQVTLVRDEVNRHKSTECPLRLVKCRFKWAGCHQIIPHKDIHQHIIDSHDNHINLITKFYEEQIQSLQECKAKLINQKQCLSRINETVCTQMSNLLSSYNNMSRAYDLVNDLISTFEHDNNQLETENRELNRKYDALNSEIKEKDNIIKEKDKKIKEKDKQIEDICKWFCCIMFFIVCVIGIIIYMYVNRNNNTQYNRKYYNFN